MPRQSKAEINAEIIDRAAGLFARHGFTHTSLQQIADAVGYSKAGLLHHFPSKQALYDAALTTVGEYMQMLLDAVKDIAVGNARDRAVVEASVEFTYSWPGVSSLANRLSDRDQDVDPALIEAGMIMYAALGIDLNTVTQERIIRVTSAFTGLGMTALAAVRNGLTREWREGIIVTAMDALGHR